MTITIELPKIPKLDCGSDGKISKKDLDAYFKNIGRTLGRLNLSVSNVDVNDKCGGSIIIAIAAIEEIVSILDAITTKPFDKLKSFELELKYRARELGKDIEEYFKKKIVDILLDLIGILGIPNPFEIPIPFIGKTADGYDPKIIDLFTKDGQKKVKSAIKEDIKKVEDFLGIDASFNGDLGIKIPDLNVEETWHKVKNWFNQLINDFIGSVNEAIASILKNIPIIGKPIYDLVTGAVDPTIAIEKAFDKLVAEYKAKIKKAKEDFLSGKILEDIGDKLLQEVVDKILDIEIPLIGKIGDLIDIDKKDIHIKALDFHELEDAVKEFIQKARRFFKGGITVKINDIIAGAPGYILTNFPIVGKIFNIIKKVADIISGKNPLTECDVLNIIVPPIFNMGSLIENALPDCVQVKYVE